MDLSENELQHFKSLLLKLKTELVEAGKTGQQAVEVVELDQARVGRLSRMDAMQAQAMSVETGRRRRMHILAINTAVVRIESGEYGYCFDCGETINPRRLEADPATRLCISCAEAAE